MLDRTSLIVGLLALGLGCGPSIVVSDDDSGAGLNSDSGPGTTGVADSGAAADTRGAAMEGGPPPTGPVPPTADTSDGAVSEEGGLEGPLDDDSGCGFLCRVDGGDILLECDIWLQDCPGGEKCMPWAYDGGSVWNGTRCAPVARNPGQPGDACMVEGSPASGFDDCDIDAMCWNVDPETLQGECIATCTGTADEPQCQDPSTGCSISNGGVLALCLETCDPVLQTCPEGETCFPSGDNFLCGLGGDGDGGVGDDCEFITTCDPGLACVAGDRLTLCESGGCCSSYCMLSDPNADAQCAVEGVGQVCVPWYDEGQAPVGMEDVGICALP